MYYASRELRSVEERYPPMEKLAFALVTAARKLKSYFQAYTVNVLTDKPLRQAMSNPEAMGRLALWAIELSEFDIRYRPRTAIKGQIVADFIAKFTHDEDKGAEESLFGAYIRTGPPTDKPEGPASYYYRPKEMQLNVWSISTSPLPTMNQSMKH